MTFLKYKLHPDEARLLKAKRHYSIDVSGEPGANPKRRSIGIDRMNKIISEVFVQSIVARDIGRLAGHRITYTLFERFHRQ